MSHDFEGYLRGIPRGSAIVTGLSQRVVVILNDSRNAVRRLRTLNALIFEPQRVNNVRQWSEPLTGLVDLMGNLLARR